MKRLISILLIFIFVFVMSSCDGRNTLKVTNPDAGYEIVKEEGEYHIVVDATEEYLSHVLGSGIGCPPAPELDFDTLEEMRSSILNGTLTENQKDAIILAISLYGKFKIPDLNNLHYPITPFEEDYSYISILGGENYHCIYKDLPSEVIITIHSEELFEINYQKKFVDSILNNQLGEVIEIKEDEDRNATVYYTKTNVYEKKFMQYKIVTSDREIFVNEYYVLKEFKDTDLSVSETVPIKVEIMGKMEGGYFEVTVNPESERPSLEWISSFGLEKARFD